MELYKKNTTPIGSKAKQENPELIERGILHEVEAPEYCNEYDKIIAAAMKGK
jgi:2-oxoglutarate ferredoxin oxidoreductase subunit beta